MFIIITWIYHLRLDTLLKQSISNLFQLLCVQTSTYTSMTTICHFLLNDDALNVFEFLIAFLFFFSLFPQNTNIIEKFTARARYSVFLAILLYLDTIHDWNLFGSQVIWSKTGLNIHSERSNWLTYSVVKELKTAVLPAKEIHVCKFWVLFLRKEG